MLIDPHAHMIARTTDDYEAMAASGVVAVIEPAFWLGQARTNVGSFVDYFSTITGFERFRAAQFGIRHYCAIGLNPKEANNRELADAVLDVLPRYLGKEGVVALGEIGYDEQTELEDRALRAQIELAKAFDLPIMIHTPHRDKKRGTRRTMDTLEACGFDPARCVIDHNNEETVQEVLDRGYWCAFTIYPSTKMGNDRLAAIVERYGPERIIVDSACDWACPIRWRWPSRRASWPPRPGRGRDTAGGLPQRAGGLRPERRNERDPLAGARSGGSTHAVRRQLGAARPNAARGSRQPGSHRMRREEPKKGKRHDEQTKR
ncbi:putative DNAse [Chromobacterium violaceum]|uniref:Putative DNAse n=1 Tax=Chromobacterium violaceum TaxID=536 RepID=A0A3S4IHH1_CHRVL|nr:putative DNAse [Chromobacterium violaceum]